MPLDDFVETELELLKTFADQAVIAIENVRLFTELQEKNRALSEAHAQVTETLEQQTATAEILQIISSTRTDVQPVFDAIVASAARVCRGDIAIVLRLIDDQFHLAAHWNTSPEWRDAAERIYPIPASSAMAGLAIRERRIVYVPDIEAEERFPAARDVMRTMGLRSFVFVPMIQGGVPVGAIGLGGLEPFSDVQLDLIQTFADQGVIALENARLLGELQARTNRLTRSSSSSPRSAMSVGPSAPASISRPCSRPS